MLDLPCHNEAVVSGFDLKPSQPAIRLHATRVILNSTPYVMADFIAFLKSLAILVPVNLLDVAAHSDPHLAHSQSRLCPPYITTW
jgi:hypothetical protein